MVDRIVPRPHRSRWRKSPPCWGRRSLRHQLRTLHSVGGRRSLCRRATRRETAGVQMTDDVLPEQMKLRMLNGSHSFLAWRLSGRACAHDCMRDDVFRRAARQLMLDEQAPTLTITGVDLLAYADSLIARFSNPALKHRTGKSPWTVARSCPSACSMASAYIWRATAVGHCWLSAWPAGCATSAARTTPVDDRRARSAGRQDPAAGGPER